MPRVTELAGYHFAVSDTQILDIDPETGQPRMIDGQPQTVAAKQLIFFEPVRLGPTQVAMGDQVKVTLPDEAKTELVRLLTGGIVVANGSGAVKLDG